jgi:CBS domain containing-hemolysin-like protein
LIGNNLVNVVLSIYAASLGDSILAKFAISGAIGLMIVSFTITFLILLFGEIIPKVIATRFSLKLGLLVAPVIYFLTYLLFPVVVVLEGIVKLLNKMFSSSEDKVSKEDIEIFIEDGQKQGLFSQIESDIIKNFLEFRDRGVESILKHRTEVFALPADIKLKDAIKQVLQKPYSRIPVYEGDKDNII